MNDITFATLDDIKDYSPLSKNISPELITPFIKLAETFHIKPVLGDNFYDELIDHISGDTLSGANYTLVYEYIVPASIWFSLYEALPFVWTRMNARGLTKSSSNETSEPLDVKEYEKIRQEIYEKGVSFNNIMKTYLIDNKDTFTTYAEDTHDESYDNSSGIFLD